MRGFLIIIEKGEDNFSACCPDLPGVMANGNSREEVVENMYVAVKLHVEGLKEEGLPVPEQRTTAEYVVLQDS